MTSYGLSGHRTVKTTITVKYIFYSTIFNNEATGTSLVIGKGKGHPITCHLGPRGGVEV
jgi:hypothetical protein